MSKLSTSDRKYIDNALRLRSGGWIIGFSADEFKRFFDELDINIDDPKYAVRGPGQADKMETFFDLESNQTVGRAILEFAAMFRNRELGQLFNVKFSVELEKIGNKLMMIPDTKTAVPKPIPETTNNNPIQIEIRPEIYEHVKQFLDTGDYFHAVDEAYKIVRAKLKALTGKEKAIDVFNANAENNRHQEQILGYSADPGTPECDFYRGTGYIHLAIQFLRNEKAHTIAHPLDWNLTIHYLALASLAYDLISRDTNEGMAS